MSECYFYSNFLTLLTSESIYLTSKRNSKAQKDSFSENMLGTFPYEKEEKKGQCCLKSGLSHQIPYYTYFHKHKCAKKVIYH